MATIHENAYFIVQDYVASAYLRVVRTDRIFETPWEALHVFGACRDIVRELDGERYGLLYDWRRSPISNDPKLHKALVTQMDSIAAQFRRKAILVATAVGTIQANRVGRVMSGDALQVFDDEAAALDFVTSR